jgi:uracil-DNA glycosylase family 4
MSFMPTTGSTREVQPLGRPDAKIAIVGDVSDNFDIRSLRPFSGPAGTVLEQCLHAAGLIRGECYITNAVKSNTPLERYVDERRKMLTLEGQAAANDLMQELLECEANIIVACGNFPFCALTGAWGVSQYRGYIFDGATPLGRKVIPIFHPKDAIYGTYIRRHLISTDLKKAKFESEFRELIRPQRQLVYSFDTLTEVLEWLEYFETQEVVCCDIEVLNYAVSLISFSSDPTVACAIPITSNKWTAEQEMCIWRGIQRVLGNPKSKKVLQNGIFDIQFLLAQNGIIVRGPILDTMIGHSVVYPDLQKGLGFLGSIYCGAQAYWKDKVKFNDIKENS